MYTRNKFHDYYLLLTVLFVGNYVKVILSNHKEPDKMILKSKIRRAITQFFVEQSADHLGGAAAAGAADNGLPVSLNQ